MRRAIKRAGARSKECAVAVSGDAAITKIIQMPRNLRESELESQVEMQADQYIPFPMEEVSFDFEVVGPSEKDPEMIDVLLVATRSENVEQRQAAVQAAGLTARLVDVEAFALENACRLLTHQMPDGGMERNIAVVDFGASSTTFSVLRDLKVSYTRDFSFGGQQLTEEIMRTYGLSMEEAGRAKKEGGLPANYQSEVLDPFIDDMCQQVSRSLQFYLASGSGPRATRADPDLRRLREHSWRRRRGREPGRHSRRARRSARADEDLDARAGAGREEGRDRAAHRLRSGAEELRLTCQELTYCRGAKRSASASARSSSSRSAPASATRGARDADRPWEMSASITQPGRPQRGC